jgi:hypothetical protein
VQEKSSHVTPDDIPKQPLGLLKSQECIHDALDVFFRKVAVLLAEIFSQWLESVRGIDKPHFAGALLGLTVGQNPDVSGNGGVQEGRFRFIFGVLFV